MVGFSLLAITLAIAVGVTLLRRRRWRMLRERDESPEDAYHRAVSHLRGGGIHPGGQPSKPPRPNNMSGGGGAY
jgi:hypothetical protein